MIQTTLFATFFLLQASVPVSHGAITVAERLIQDSSFTLEQTTVKPSVFPMEMGCKYSVQISEDGDYVLGYNTVTIPKEIAYDSFLFERYDTLTLSRGPFELPGIEGLKYCGFVDNNGMADSRVNVSVIEHGKPRTSLRIAPKSDAAFNKHPYTEWHYANGATLCGLSYFASLCDEGHKKEFSDHVDRVLSWNRDHFELFRSQYDAADLRTQNYRLFRCAMLDDSSAPALPYVEAAARGRVEFRTLADTMAVYVMLKQYRLEDGTLCRPEPKWTVWCDDMFMGSAFLCRYYDLTSDRKYLDEACRQAVLFYTHLIDPQSGLLYHAWNDSLKERVGACWGRANGWYLWAVSDILLRLQESGRLQDASRGSIEKQILTLHNSLLEQIAARQDESGMLHQVLNREDTYLETSATCALAFTLARAVRMGWLPESYASQARLAWKAIEQRISEDGVVSGICRSMSLQNDVEGYNSRATAGNDPRGLGLFFMAAAESALLEEYLGNN